ncbi:glycosyltransferase [Pseudozobellia thermophila]|uniref:N-acetylgalactosamine-N,N'-diacetylbacillosaminyl-diphospho-undecaprenol 4-alpha-N-acetylgalactosaminyltransferase n=1 Tax=Pseudozobellia thermophila TaxID=192903 RepID=A0A1M6IWB3_9FLAO|nr:glycosyltransferase [Pseudozobellia thermophila]SHJ38728.1 N-acetylgalactosamine-N,N'-diacetylbacillosaminyl-diphospho-undecaprenol 4-alpha-N-acetylgalactosaminyltransferase [Pseudozobellia thermophila]
MNVTLFIYSMAGGGAERVVSYLLPHLKRQGFTVHLVLMNDTISYDIPKDINIHFLERSKGDENGIIKLLKLPFLAFKYARLLKKLDVTHSFSLLTRPNYINTLSQLFTSSRPKIIISERSFPSLQYGYGDFQSKANNWLISKLYPKADYILCNSQGNANDLIKNYDIDSHITDVIYNPVDIKNISKRQAATSFFDPDYFNMITVGRLDAGKNHELLIRALPSLTQARLYILGSGVLLEYLTELTKELNLQDRIFFLGFDNNPYQYLKGADLFVFGSNHEGFPNVLLEAMCCGLPILTTNCKSGPSEIMELKAPLDDDIMKTPYGILTPVGNVDLMAKGMSFFLENPDYLSDCRAHVLERVKDFGKEGILEAYEKALIKQ